ncbi:hypothetical protein KKF84_04475 [Myxococcota bacterium]|nr:hypothetical protein [Myxococcota bacterium]
MRLPPISENSEKLLVLGSYHQAMLETDERLEVLSSVFSSHQKRLREAKDQFQNQEELTMRAFAMKNFCDDMLEREATTFELKVAEQFNKDRASEGYLALFPKGLDGITRVSLAKMMEAVKLLEASLEQSGLPEEILSFGESLRLKRMKAHEAVTAYRSALRAESEARMELRLIKEEWLRLYSINYDKILTLYNKDRARVFFRKQYRKILVTEDDLELD